MKTVKLIAVYLWQCKKLILLFALFVLIFAFVFSLYSLETEAVWYAGALCTVIGLIVFTGGLIAFIQKHRYLTKLEHLSDPYELPPSASLIERDYISLLKRFYDDSQKILNEVSRGRRDMEEYYSLWVHQIKSPLAAMRLLLQSEDNAQNTALLLELFRIEQYVEMVLSYVRLKSDTNDFVISRYPLGDIVRSAVRKYAPVFINKKLSLDLREITCTVLTDEKWLLFVIEQILSNALKYTPSGQITIQMQDEKLVIGDSGIGIAPEDLPRIGEKGFTGYNGRYDKKASGIGLFLCKTVCQKLGHVLMIESEPGVGTKVMIGLDAAHPVFE